MESQPKPSLAVDEAEGEAPFQVVRPRKSRPQRINTVQAGSQCDVNDVYGIDAIDAEEGVRQIRKAVTANQRLGIEVNHFSQSERCTVTPLRCLRSGRSAVPRPGPVMA